MKKILLILCFPTLCFGQNKYVGDVLITDNPKQVSIQHASITFQDPKLKSKHSDSFDQLPNGYLLLHVSENNVDVSYSIKFLKTELDNGEKIDYYVIIDHQEQWNIIKLSYGKGSLSYKNKAYHYRFTFAKYNLDDFKLITELSFLCNKTS